MCYVVVLSSVYRGPWLVACFCAAENAQCSTITCADGWSADSSADDTKCAGLECDASGADNALCCNGAICLLRMTRSFVACFRRRHPPIHRLTSVWLELWSEGKGLQTETRHYMRADRNEYFESSPL